MSSSDLFYTPKPNSSAAIKLFCFPFAGGNSSVFLPLVKVLNPQVEVVLIQLPGRGMRFRDTPYSTMDSLTNDLLTEIIPLIDKPYAFFGYSLGAKVAFELARKLKGIGFPLPVHFIAAASPAPYLPRRIAPIHNLPDKAFIKALSEYNGTPADVLDDEDMMELLLPALRGDFSILETYRASENDILATRLTTYGGAQDGDVVYDDILAWQTIFKGSVTHRIIPGGHFFISESADIFAKEINNLLQNESSFEKTT